ncbi:MAG: FAD-dependent oxidoreductase, partial [Prosthecobacter sp.]|nr:FAD-dependent oxidoreductase [Prosthecobacter sp.]
MSDQQSRIVIVGAGLAGLACARVLAAAGREFTLLEASDAVGGRVRTDVLDGFLLDRGFQIFLPAYPEARR